MNATTTLPVEPLARTMNVELLSEEDLLSISGGGVWTAGALLLAGGAAAAVVGVAAGAAVYLICRAVAG